MNLSKFAVNDKIVGAGFIIGIISLFMTWVDVGFYSENGFQQGGYLVLIAFLYSIVSIATGKNYNRKVSAILLVMGIIFMIFFICSKSVGLFSSSINCAGIGMYVMIVGLVVSLAGTVKDFKANRF